MSRLVKYQAGRAFLEPTKETMDGLEAAIRWAETEVPQSLRRGMNELVFHMALVNQGIARKMSFGPYDPSGSNTSQAWRSPEQGIRRITENYYLGWKVRQIRPGVWQLYNDSREAYFIEFGINWLGGTSRIRRPVRKLSLRRTMEKMMTTQAYHRIWVDIYADPRHRHRGMGFTQIVQSPGGRWVDMTDREIGSMVRGYQRSGSIGFHIRQRASGQTQRWRSSAGRQGSYGGPSLGRRLP
jgi:hypothetical protein